MQAFDRADKNHDGRLSQDEYNTLRTKNQIKTGLDSSSLNDEYKIIDAISPNTPGISKRDFGAGLDYVKMNS